MAGIDPNMSPEHLMNEFVPGLIASKLSGIDFHPLSDHIEVRIEGVGEWTACIDGGKPSVRAGAPEAPLIIAHVGTAAVEAGILRAAQEIPDIDALEVGMLAALIAKLLTQELADQVRANVKGTIKLAVTGDSSEHFALVGFGGLDPDNPTCTVMTSEDELLDIVEGEMAPQQAFMKGKIRFDGDMAPAMTLGMIAVPLLLPALRFVKQYLRERG